MGEGDRISEFSSSICKVQLINLFFLRALANVFYGIINSNLF